MEIKKGKAFKFGDGISTDHIAPGRLFHLRSNLEEFSKHVLEDADPDFAKNMKKGDFVVAGNNFGLGSSREHAPQIIIGLLLIECDTDKIDAGDELELDVQKGILKDLTKNIEIEIMPLPDVMIKLLNDGGLIEHIKKNGDFSLV